MLKAPDSYFTSFNKEDMKITTIKNNYISLAKVPS